MLAALAPVFAIILLGYALKRFGFPGDEFWPAAERATYYLFFPALLFGNLARGDFGNLAAAPMALALAAAVLAVAGTLLVLRIRLPFDGPGFTSVFQGSIRPNTYVGLAGAAALYGPRGLTLAAMAIVTLIPLVNLLCVPTVSRYGSLGRKGLGASILEVARNPLILSCAAGFVGGALALPFPRFLFDVVDILARTALPLALLAVGAGLRFGGMASRARGIAISSAAKLAILPLLTLAGLRLLGVSGEPAVIAMLFTALPTSASSYILARQLGGDHVLMAAIITFHTIVSVATLPLLLSLAP